MADLAWEFAQAVALAWLCFGFGVVLFRMGLDYQCLILSRGLLFLSPFVLTCFGVHATRENQQLAAIVAAKKSEAISGRVYLTSATKTDLGYGVRIEREQYSDGQRSVCAQMSTGEVDTIGPLAGPSQNAPTPGGTGGSAIRMREWRADGGDPFATFSADGGPGLVESF